MREVPAEAASLGGHRLHRCVERGALRVLDPGRLQSRCAGRLRQREQSPAAPVSGLTPDL